MLRKILNYPFSKILIGIAVCVAAIVLVQFGLRHLLVLITPDETLINAVCNVSAAIAALLAYTFLFRFYDNRAIIELSVTNIVKDSFRGLITGTLLMCLTMLVIYLNHGLTIASVNNLTAVLPALLMSLSAAVTEELIFRGIIFQITEASLGSYWALFVSAFIFGAAHFANPNSTVLSSLAIAIEAGLLLGAAYMYTKNLWFAIALHFAWDFIQAGIFGATESGIAINQSLLTTKINGNDLITGGKFGPEASIQAIVFCLLAGTAVFYLAKKQSKLVKPYWKINTEAK